MRHYVLVAIAVSFLFVGVLGLSIKKNIATAKIEACEKGFSKILPESDRLSKGDLIKLYCKCDADHPLSAIGQDELSSKEFLQVREIVWNSCTEKYLVF